MAAELLALAHQQAIGTGSHLAVPKAQGPSSSRRERQQTRHGMGPARRILERAAQQQQPTALGHHRQPSANHGAQIGQAALGAGEGAGMQLGVAPGQHHRPAAGR